MQEFLLAESTVREDGAGPVIGLGAAQGAALAVTLGITHIIEQESLDVAIWGSADQANWGAKPLYSFPQKFYCGHYAILVDLGSHPDIQFLQVRWKTARWGRGEPKPLFTFYVYAESVQARQATAA